MLTPACSKGPRTAYFSILLDHNARAMSEEEFALRLEAFNLLLFNSFSMINYQSHTHTVVMHGCSFLFIRLKEVRVLLSERQNLQGNETDMTAVT